MNPRRIMYGGGLLVLVGVWALALGGQPIAAITFGLGFATGLALLGLAVILQRESQDKVAKARSTAGMVRCEVCDRPTRRIPHPHDGDSWFFECDRGHHTIIGK